MNLLSFFLFFVGAVYAASRTTPPSGALVVSQSATSGQYATIQKAVDALSTSSAKEQIIFINPGTYNEQVYVPKLAGLLTIYGYTSDTTSYSANKVTITHNLSLATQANDDLTATLRVLTTNGFKLYNVNVVNTYGQGSQALALSAYGTAILQNQGYYACQFRGFQDTILAETGAQLYAKSYIEGATDFIFGQTATAWFEQVNIGVLATSVGYVTANGRDSASNPSYYVINKSTIAAASGSSVSAGSYYLGRPWRDYARVVFQDTSMTNVINSVGWSQWSSSSPLTDHVTFAEYGNSGAGASGTRASFASKLSSPVAIGSILGSGYASATWVDTSYIG